MATNTELVQQLYIAYFNRPGDAAGVEYYVDLLGKGVSIDVLRADFVQSKEYTATYAGKSTEAVVNQIYNNIFGHAADIPGLKYYAGLIDAKTVSYDLLPWLIAGGAQTTDKVAFESKATAAAAFTNAIAADANLRVAYANGGDAAINTARGFLASVTDAASLATAVAGVATAVQGVVPVTNTTLTQGLDNIVGGAGNDVINAFASNPTTGTDANTLTSVDSIDGGAGTDTLNIEVKTAGGTTYNNGITGTIKNIEIVNINQVGATTAIAVDASKLGSSLQQVWQQGKAGDVTALAATSTAGFRDVNQTVNVAAAATAAKASVALQNFTEGNTINVSGDALTGVTVTGSVVDGADAGTAVGAVTVALVAAKDVESVTVNTAVKTTLTVTNAAGGTKTVSTVDASASTGGVTFAAGGATGIASIKGGSGDDTLTITTATAAATTSAAAVNASVVGGAGKDTITVTTTGVGTTTVDAGDGNDKVNVTARSTGVLTVNLGAGDDSFTSSVAIGAKDAIDAGAGTDTLLLNLVGSANIGAFSNFDAFDAAGLARSLDVDILAAKNNVTEFVASADVGANAALANIGANVGFRATGDLGTTNTLSLTQKTAGALTVTVDADETGSGDTAIDTVSASVNATNATSLKAVFGTAYLADIAGETTTGDNVTTLNLTSGTAASLTVESGGALSKNVLNFTDAAGADDGDGKLATITITGDRAITVNTTDTVALTSVDSSAATGGLTFSLDSLKDKGSVKLGTGVDLITVTGNSTVGGVETISGFEKAAAAAVGTNATAKAAAILDADQLNLDGATAVVADSEEGATGDTIADGVLTFSGAGPATIAAAAGIADGIAEDGQALVFEYLGNSYVFVQGGEADTLVQITGVTGVKNLAVVEDTSHFFLV